MRQALRGIACAAMPPAPTTIPRPHAALRLALGGLLAMATALGIGRFAYTPILPPMSEALGWSKTDAGLVASANLVGYLAGALWAARPIAPGSRRRWLLAALAASGATTAGMGLTDSLFMHMGLRLLGGVASAFVIVLASSLVLERLARTGSNLSAVHFAGVGTGIAVSAVVVSALDASGAGWQAAWLVAGAIGLAAAAGVALLVPEDGPEPAAAAAKAAPASTSREAGGLGYIILAYGLFGFGYIITATFLISIVRTASELRELEPWVWIVVGCAAVPSVALWTWIGSRLGLTAGLAIACAAEAVGVAASVEWLTAAGVFVSAVLLGGTFMGITALGLMAARQASPGDAQRAMGLMTASFATGQMIGPTFAGLLYESLGSFRLPTLAAAGALAAAALLAIAARRKG